MTILWCLGADLTCVGIRAQLASAVEYAQPICKGSADENAGSHSVGAPVQCSGSRILAS